MAVDRAIVIIILSLIGLVIVLYLIIYFYNYPKRYVSYFNVSNASNYIETSAGLLLLYSKKRGDTMSFFIFLILAVIVIIAIALLYYLSYKQIMLANVTNKAEGLINITAAGT